MYKFDFDLENKIIRGRCKGVVTDETLRAYYASASRYGRLNPTFSAICETSGVTFLAVSSRTVLELAKLPPAVPDPDIPRFIVAGSYEMFGMARMFEFEGGETRPNLHIVRSEREALSMLGVKKARFESVESANTSPLPVHH